MANNYNINYNDKRFQQVEADKKQALSEVEKTYSGMISEADKYYQAQIDASKQWGETQQKLQQENTDFAIEKIEQQKEQANKDYLREQSGAYVDWQKESNKYGANAEQMASSGLANTGYSESSQVSMYNTYQNRVATARESYNKAILNYDNAIKDAQLQNNSVLAEIAYKSLQTELELSLQGFQYKNQLVLDQANKKLEVDNMYYNRYQDVLEQMNTENALAEQIRQFNQNYQLQLKEYQESIRQFDAEMARLKAKDAQEYKLEIQQLELQKKKVAQEQAQFEKEYSLKQQQLAEEKRQFDESLSASKGSSKISSSGNNNSNAIKINQTSGINSSKLSDNSEAVNTAYYKGTKNHDVYTFGAFANGYQPKGISGHGELSKTGQTVEIATETLYGQKQRVVQNVWEASDGTKWYWEGRQNKYIQIK